MSHYDFIVSSQAAGDSRDAIIISLVSEYGLSLNAATRAYADAAKAEGWTTGRESHKDAAIATLTITYGSDWDAAAVKAAVVELAAEYGVAESTARDYCRAYSEVLDVPHPVEDPRKAMFDWLVENAATAEKADFVAFAGEGGLGRSASNVNEYWKGLELHRAILAAQ